MSSPSDSPPDDPDDPTLVAEMGDAYPELRRAQPVIAETLRQEEERFHRTLGRGMALLEEAIYDQRTGQPINGSMADYLMATCADSPEIDVTFLNYPDPAMGEYGARGIGEIGLAGVAPAITAAVYHATGVRVRELPVRIEDLLKSTILEA